MMPKPSERILERDEIAALEDDGSTPDCAACAYFEGRAPRWPERPSLSMNVLHLAAPLLERFDEAPRRVWLTMLELVAMAWNRAVEGGTAQVVVQAAPNGPEQDATKMLDAFARRKRELFPDDDRRIGEVRLSEKGELWCVPLGTAPQNGNTSGTTRSAVASTSSCNGKPTRTKSAKR